MEDQQQTIRAKCLDELSCPFRFLDRGELFVSQKRGFGKTEWLPLSGHSTCDALASLFADAAKALSIDLTDEMKNIHPVMKT